MPKAKNTRRKPSRDLMSELIEHMEMHRECQTLCEQAVEARESGDSRKALAFERKARKLMQKLLAFEASVRSQDHVHPLDRKR